MSISIEFSPAEIHRRVSDRRELTNWLRQAGLSRTDDSANLATLVDLLGPLFQYLADGYKYKVIGPRAFVLLYACRPDLIDGDSLTDGGKVFGVTRQSMQTQLEKLKWAFPSLEVRSEQRRGQWKDSRARAAKAAASRAAGKAQGLTCFARRKEGVA